MLTTEHINSFRQLARDQSVEGETLRRRTAAIGAITLSFCGFLLAVGLAVVVLILLAGIVAVVGLAMLRTLWPRLRRFGGNALAHVRDGAEWMRRQLMRLCRRVPGAARKASISARTHGNALARAGTGSVSRAARRFDQAARATTLRFASRTARVDSKREAIRLNATGTQRRRAGRNAEAVDCHRRALEILRQLGDRRAIALTQSNLALALSHGGDDAWAVGLLEEAAATLRELGDDEDEARIMANLGVTHRRHGRLEEADNVFELALSKLTPASSTYQAIEAELRRAS